GADDDADREVDDVAPHDEFFEAVEHLVHGFSLCSDVVSTGAAGTRGHRTRTALTAPQPVMLARAAASAGVTATRMRSDPGSPEARGDPMRLGAAGCSPVRG